MKHPKDLTPNDIFKKLTHRWPENFYDLYPGYSKSISDNHDCFFQTKSQAYEVANEVIDKLSSFPSRITVFRTLSVERVEHINYKDIGESWSFKKESAISFGKRELPSGKLIILLVGEIDHSHVDWNTTLEKYLVYSMGDSDENELYIRHHQKVLIVDKIWIREPKDKMLKS